MKFGGEDSYNFERNVRVAKGFVLFFFAILFVRLFYLQIFLGEEFRVFSEKNLFKEQLVYAPRGRIYDRDGNVLVENLPAYRAVVIPQYTKDMEALAEVLGKALDMKAEEIKAKVKKSRRQNGPFHPVPIKQHISRDELFKVELLRLDHAGLDAQEFILRHYPKKGMGAHLLGYVGEITKKQIPVLRRKRNIKFRPGDIIGQRGIEEQFDTSLRGEKGKEFVIVNAQGRRPAKDTSTAIGGFLKDIPAKLGTDIYTTIDSDLQQAAYDAFVKHKRVGSLIAMTPQGEVLAWISHPPFDPNILSKKKRDAKKWRRWVNDSDRPLRNKVIQDHYSPGSTFKPIVALAALQSGNISEDKYIYAPWRMKFGRRMYHDHRQRDSGYINVVQALERSNNIFFYKQGMEIGVDVIARYAKAMGFGARTGVPLRGETPGLIPTKEWKEKRYGVPWQPGESLSVAIGQSFLLTNTIQLAQAYSAIALEGKVYQPQIIKKVVNPSDPSKPRVNEPKLVRDLADPEYIDHISTKNFKTVKKGLYRVVNGEKGTARSARIKGKFKIAGKTGTAQVRSFSADQLYKDCTKIPKKERHNGWFAGYAPADVPEITVAVLTEHSCKSSASIPVAKDVIMAYLKKYHKLNTGEDES